MKILLLGDASNYHNTLSLGLQRLGHDVTVASSGMLWQNTRRDIDLRRGPGKISGALLWLRLNTSLAESLRGYDVVQLVNPIFVDLKPHRVASLFRRIRRNNGAVFLTALGTDTAFARMVNAYDNPLRFSEWNVEGQPTPFSLSPEGVLAHRWLEEPLSSHCQMIYDNVDGVVSALYEYHCSMLRVFEPGKLAYGGIPIDISTFNFRENREVGIPLKALAPFPRERRLEKGIDRLCDIARTVAGVEVEPITGLGFSDFIERLASADVVLDQYYAHSPATTALMAMAMGIPVVTGASKQFAEFIGEKIPAVNINPLDHESVRDFLTDLAENSGKSPTRSAVLKEFGNLEDMLKSARSFVERHNSADIVARRFADFWQKNL